MNDSAGERFAFLIGDHSAAVPALPENAQRAVMMASDPDVPAFRLAELIGKDQVFASRVMGLANSAASAPAMYISTVMDAIVRVGTAATRNTIVAVSLASRMQDSAIYGDRGRALFDHSLGTAYMARLVAEPAGVHTEEAFLAGLMHDIGKLVILRMVYDYRKRTGQEVPAQDVDDALQERHAMMGALALRRWHLPDTIDDPVMFHHSYDRAPRYPKEAAVCYLANRLSHRYGFGCERELSEPATFMTDEVFDVLNLNAAWLAATDARGPGLVAVARKALG
jgi:putative nucleotidyltransferase with HDIG domain